MFVDLEKRCKTNIWVQKLVLIQQRTDRLKLSADAGSELRSWTRGAFCAVPLRLLALYCEPYYRVGLWSPKRYHIVNEVHEKFRRVRQQDLGRHK